MKGQHKPGYKKPRTGDKRSTRQPFKIDSLPLEVRDEIQKLRANGQTWQEISEATGLSASTLRDWYDVRIEQVQAEVLAQAEHSRTLAASFAGKGFEKLPESVQAALSSAIFAMAESQDVKSRQVFITRMNELAWLLARNRQLDQEDKRLAIEGKKLETIVAKITGVKKDMAKKKMTSEELAQKLDEIYGIAKPAA